MIGRTVSHYRITGKIGEGGMGVVYRAEDTRLEREVALKFISRADLQGEKERTRLIREGQAAASLNHPNICTVYEMEECDGKLFIAMEYVEGKSLSSLISDRSMGPQRALDITVQILAGLEHAHRRGVIHRDIKPDNIMITEEGMVKIMDFGLALAENRSRLTAEGATMGTAAYMSPEQVRGEEVDGRTDIWSVGAILYEMLSGEKPFCAEHNAAILYAIVNEEPRPIKEIVDRIPDGLDSIIAGSLIKDKEKRYSSAEDMASDLEILYQGRKSSIKAGASRSAGNKRNYIIAIVAAIIIALLGFQLYQRYWQDTSEISRRMMAILPFENLGNPEDQYFADGITEEITSRLSMISGLGVISRTSSRKYAGTEKSIEEIGSELGVDYIIEGTVRWARTENGRERVRITPQLIRVSDDTHLWAKPYNRVIEDIFAIQAEIANDVAEALDITLLGSERERVSTPLTRNLEAYNEYMRGRYYATRPHFSTENWNSMIDSYERAVEIDPGFALVHAELARAHAGLRYYLSDLSPERADMARRSAERALELTPISPKVHVALASYHLYLERDTEAAMNEIELAEQKLHRDAELLKVKGEIHSARGRFKEAVNAFSQAFELSPRDPSIQVELAICRWVEREYPEAQKAAEKAIELAPGEMWSHLAVVLVDLSWKGGSERGIEELDRVERDHPWPVFLRYYNLMLRGKYRDALESLKLLSDDWLRIKICSRPKSLFSAIAHEKLGDREAALRLYGQARDTLEAELGKWPDDPRLHSALGIAYASLGRGEEAVREGRRAMELLPISRDAFYGIPYEWDMGVIYTMAGEREEALRMIERLLDIPSWISAAWLRSHSLFSPLKSDPDFERILQKHSGKTSA